MIRVYLGPGTLGRVRFAPSPMFEAAAWLSLTAQGRRHPILGDPGSAARFALRDRDVAAAAVAVSQFVTRRCYIPDFLTPQPRPGPDHQVIVHQLEQARSTASDIAEQQLGASRLPAALLWRYGLQGGQLPVIAAGGLWKFWNGVLADQWPALNRVFAAHIDRAGRTAARHGLAAALNTRHPLLSCRSDTLTVGCSGSPAGPQMAAVDLRLIDCDLVIIPSLLSPPRLLQQLDDPQDASVIYPMSRPVTANMQLPSSGRTHSSSSQSSSGFSPSTPPSSSSTGIVGPGRHRVLTALQSPLSTRRIARAVGLTESTTSHHLRALVAADLADRQRRGREVVYSLTASGQRLLDLTGNADLEL